MRSRAMSLIAAGALALVPALLASNDARACGGCFHVESQTESTVVTGHRMAFALSPTHTVLWDQIQYSGQPGVVRVGAPGQAGRAHRALQRRLVRGARRRDHGPDHQPALRLPRDGLLVGLRPRLRVFGCILRGRRGAADPSSGDGRPPGHRRSLRDGHPPLHRPRRALDVAHDEQVRHRSSVQPVVDAYTQEGFDFIALRLLPIKACSR